MKEIRRRKTAEVKVGHCLMGSEHPIVVQSMTNTLTSNVERTVSQIIELADAGSELVRITVNDKEAAQAVPKITARLLDKGYTTPIIGDFHYNGHILLKDYPKAAAALSKYRINPGNVGKGRKRDDNFATMIQVAKDYDKPVRIGVNGGSLDEALLSELMEKNAAQSIPKAFDDVLVDAMVKSAIQSAEYAESLGLGKDKLIISVKVSEVQQVIQAYEQLAAQTDYVLHLGLTEAGAGVKGLTSSSAALAILLQQGIGDTIRISLTPEPGIPRAQEVYACTSLLQSLQFRYFKPSITSCPGCGRTDSDYFIHLARDVNSHIEAKMKIWRSAYPGVENLKIAVMGCVVNGPGESKYADIGISLPGLREQPVAPVYIEGKLKTTLRGAAITQEFIGILEAFIKKKYQVEKNTLISEMRR